MVVEFSYKWKWTSVKDISIYEIVVVIYNTNDKLLMVRWPIFNNSD